MGERSTSDARGLRHPLWWAALVVLVLNDHVLKGAGIVPAWLTGKLSDFAGMIIAPVLLAALFRARTTRARGLAFLLVAGWFAAIKSIPGVGAATVALASYAGLDWTFAFDPTDLIAMSALPLAWHIAGHRGDVFTPRIWGQRIAIGAGVLACMASPPPEPSWTTTAFLVNRTGNRVELRVRWVDAQVDCEAIRDNFADALDRDSFMAGTLFAIEPNHTLPLDRGLAISTDPFGMPTETGHIGTCDVAILSAEGMPETVVYWDGAGGLRTIPETIQDEGDETAVVGGLDLIETEDDRLLLTGGSGYELHTPVDVYEEGAGCHDYGAITGFDWSSLPQWVGYQATLEDVTVGIDGCISLTITDAFDLTYNTFVCVPAEDFPFTSGNVVEIWNTDSELRMVRVLPRDDGTNWLVAELVVSRGAGTFREGPFDIAVAVVDDACHGVRMDCGGFRVPGAGGIVLTDGLRFVHPGEAMERDAADGRRARLRVGRAEMMWVTRAECGAGRDVLGPRLEALVVYGEETR